jgi:hypothetical protein
MGPIYEKVAELKAGYFRLFFFISFNSVMNLYL